MSRPLVTVHRIVAEPVQVEVPAQCPRETCGADLTAPDALEIYEYGVRIYQGRLDGAEAGGVALNYDLGYRDGDCGLPVETIQCARCGCTIADGAPPRRADA